MTTTTQRAATKSRIFVRCSFIRARALPFFDTRGSLRETRRADYAGGSSPSGLLDARYHLPLFGGLANSFRIPAFLHARHDHHVSRLYLRQSHGFCTVTQ